MALVIKLNPGVVLDGSTKLTVQLINQLFSLGYASIESGSIETANIGDEQVTLAKLADLTRGSVIVGGVDNRPGAVLAKAVGTILLGNGTDLVAALMSGDATISAAGVITVANHLKDTTQWHGDDTKFPEKATPVAADLMLLEDSAASWAKKKAEVVAVRTHPKYHKANLRVGNNAATPASQIDVAADEVAVTNAAGHTRLVTAVNLTINGAASGLPNELDTGSLVAGWYYVYVILDSEAGTVAGLLSAASPVPTDMPDVPGSSPTRQYDYWRLVGEAYYVASSTNAFNTFRRKSDWVWVTPKLGLSQHDLTSTIEDHPLPTGIPTSGCTQLQIVASAYTNAQHVLLEWMTDAAGVGPSVPVFNNLLAASNWDRAGATMFTPTLATVPHDGGGTTWVRSLTGSTAAGQGFHIIGYELAR